MQLASSPSREHPFRLIQSIAKKELACFVDSSRQLGRQHCGEAFGPWLEGLESCWTPALATYSNVSKTLTITAEDADATILFSQGLLPAGYITATDGSGDIFNDPVSATVPDRFVKNIVVKVPATVTGPLTINLGTINLLGQRDGQECIREWPGRWCPRQ